VVVAAGFTERVPLSALEPVQPPDAVHDVAFALDQVSAESAPAVIEGGLAVSVTVGSGAEVTVTVAEADVVSPEFVQESV
jgi:hypothetical protein